MVCAQALFCKKKLQTQIGACCGCLKKEKRKETRTVLVWFPVLYKLTQSMSDMQ